MIAKTVDVQYGRYADSIVLRAKFKTMEEVRKLFALLSNPVSYAGGHAILNQQEAAPLVLEDDYERQFLVHCQDAKYTGDGSQGAINTISITLSEYVQPLLRGY